MARPDRTLNDAQLPLAVAIQAVHLDGGRRVRALLRKAIADNGISHSSLAEELGMDESHLSRALADDKGAHPSPAVYAAVMAKDSKAILINGLAAMCGRETHEKRPDPEQELLRLRKQMRAMTEALAAALGDAP